MTPRKQQCSHGSFISLDVETASSDAGSICQLGLAIFADGVLESVDRYSVKPRNKFLKTHTAIHGLTAKAVQDAHSWNELYGRIRPRLIGKTIVSHTMFDRKAVFRACCRERVAMFSYVRWLDSCATARLAWPHLDSHALGALARHLNLPHHAHDAGEDARVAGEVFLLAQTALVDRPRD